MKTPPPPAGSLLSIPEWHIQEFRYSPGDLFTDPVKVICTRTAVCHGPPRRLQRRSSSTEQDRWHVWRSVTRNTHHADDMRHVATLPRLKKCKPVTSLKCRRLMRQFLTYAVALVRLLTHCKKKKGRGFFWWFHLKMWGTWIRVCHGRLLCWNR